MVETPFRAGWPAGSDIDPRIGFAAYTHRTGSIHIKASPAGAGLVRVLTRVGPVPDACRGTRGAAQGGGGGMTRRSPGTMWLGSGILLAFWIAVTVTP